MIFATENAISQIIAGEKTQTRRLVKEGEEMEYGAIVPLIGVKEPVDFPTLIKAKNGKTKWYVGQELAVQSGRGKSGLFYNPETRECVDLMKAAEFELASGVLNTRENLKYCYERNMHFKPLRIRITSIHKEKVLDITEADAKKEGFSGKEQFLRIFSEINYKGNRHTTAGKNPFVWVLEFKVI